MTWFAFRMNNFGTEYVPERIIGGGPTWYSTAGPVPGWTMNRLEGHDGKAFETEQECRAWCDEQNQQGRR